MITMLEDDDFVSWLDFRLRDMDWTKADLARRSGISSPQVSRVMNREQRPGVQFCKAIAKALGLSEDMVFRKAGLIATPPRTTDLIDEILSTIEGLTVQNQESVLEFAHMINNRQAKQNHASKNG